MKTASHWPRLASRLPVCTALVVAGSLAFAVAAVAAPAPTATITEQEIIGLAGGPGEFWVFDTYDTDGPGVGGDPTLTLATPPVLLPGYGTSSVRMDTGPGTGGSGCSRLGGKVFLGTRSLGGARLSDLEALGYSHLVDSTSGAVGAENLAPVINVYVDRNGDGLWRGADDSILIYEPFYTLGPPTQDIWYDNEPIGAGATGRWHYAAQSLPGVGQFTPNTVDLWDEIISQPVGGAGFDPTATTIGDLRIVNPDPGCSPSDSQEGTGSGLAIVAGQKAGTPWNNHVSFVDGAFLTTSGAAAVSFVHNFNLAPVSYTVGGTVSGLSGSGLVLQNNGGDDLPIGDNGPFTFPTALVDLSGYAVTVQTQPDGPSQTCSVSNGGGALAGSNVTDVSVTCSTDSFSIGGTVSGLSGSGLVLRNNGGDDLPIGDNGPFTFPTALVDLSGYAVTVQTQPAGQLCAVGNATGSLDGSNVTDVTVSCESVEIGVNTSALEFLFVPSNEVASATFQIANPGPVPLVIFSISEPDAPFSIAASTCQPLPLMLEPGEQCVVTVEFRARPGSFESQIVIDSSAASSPTTITLRGTGAALVPALGRFGLLLLFGMVLVIAALRLRQAR